MRHALPSCGAWLVGQDTLRAVRVTPNACPAWPASVTATSRACSEGLEPGLAWSMNRPCAWGETGRHTGTESCLEFTGFGW